MAGFNLDKANTALQTVGGLAGVTGALAGAYLNAPKAKSNKGFLKRANMVGNWDFGRSDINGLMSQIDNAPTVQNVSQSDFAPSSQEIQNSLLTAGLGAYGAASSLTAPLKGSMGTVSFDARTRKADKAVRNGQLGQADGITKDQIMQEAGYGSDTELANDWYESHFGCGGHLHGCGGHKFAGGGFAGIDVGGAVGEAVNLGTAGLGVLFNYLGTREQLEQAERNAKEVTAANAYALQLQNHNKNEAVNDTKNNMARLQGLQMMAMGGDLQTHGAEYPLFGDYNVIGAGGTHEQNPFGGVYQGMAADGKPNLVEEDEVVWNDYVFSNRLPIPKEFAKERKLKPGITYADAAQKLSKEAEERPNDPISQNGIAEALGALMDNQEELKQKREAAHIKREIAKMSPEEIMNMMAVFQAAQQQQQPVVEQPMFADGGHLYAWGGLDTLFNVDPYAASNLAQYLPYDRNRVDARDEEAKDSYKAWTDYVKDNWDSEEVQKYLKALDAKAGGNHLFDKNGKLKKGAKEYFEKARTDGKWGYYHLTPKQLAAASAQVAASDAAGATNAGSDNKSDSGNDDKSADKGKATEEVAAGRRPFTPLPTFFRYAPVVGSALGAIAASAPAKDYSTAFAPRLATYAQVGNYLPYMPVDTQRYINAQNQQTAAQLNAIMNASAGNKNMAMAHGALARQQGLQGIGQVMQGAEAINWDRLRQASDFNRGTNMFDAQGFNQSELANLGINPLMLRQEQQNAAMRQTVDAQRDAAKSENLSALFDSLAGIGQENFYMNQANSNEALRYSVMNNPFFGGWSVYKQPFAGTQEESSTDDDKKKKSSSKTKTV